MIESQAIFQYRHKIKTAEELREVIGPPPRDRKVIMCHGVFDIVHPGHLRHLLYAKSKGDILVASLTADQHITKGNVRPWVPEDLRAINLAALEMVDYVVIDGEAKPLKNLRIIQPDFFAKGYEYTAGSVNPKTQEEIDVLSEFGGEIIFTPGDIVYSSSHLIELAPPNIAVDKLVALMHSDGLEFDDLRLALGKLAGTRVHILGDTIVDSHTYCDVIGGMTKTPTVSVRFEEKQDFTGGAAVVAKHIKAGGADVTFSTVLGNDAYKDEVLQDLDAHGVVCRPVIDPTRPTTNKNAIIAPGGYRLLKIDTLDNRSISESILGRFREALGQVESDVVIFSDFRHGIFNRTTIPQLIGAIPDGVYRVADSQVASRWGNILQFQGFDLITPNEREARFALGDQDSVVRPLGLELYRQADCKTLLLKLGDRGVITIRGVPERDAESDFDQRSFFTVDSFAEHVVDPVGAGDALLAYATLAMQATGNELIATILGSFAAAIECERDGNIPVGQQDLLDKINQVEQQANYG